MHQRFWRKVAGSCLRGSYEKNSIGAHPWPNPNLCKFLKRRQTLVGCLVDTRVDRVFAQRQLTVATHDQEEWMHASRTAFPPGLWPIKRGCAVEAFDVFDTERSAKDLAQSAGARIHQYTIRDHYPNFSTCAKSSMGTVEEGMRQVCCRVFRHMVRVFVPQQLRDVRGP
jgi:hypothetical protein